MRELLGGPEENIQESGSIEMHRIKCALVESRNKFKLLKRILFSLKGYLTFSPVICVACALPKEKTQKNELVINISLRH